MIKPKSAKGKLYFTCKVMKYFLREHCVPSVFSQDSWPLNEKLYQKSDNLQNNTLGLYDDRLIDQGSDVPSIFSFIISCKIFCKNPFNLFFCFFKHCKNKNEIKEFWMPKLTVLFSIYQHNTWTIRRLVDETSDPPYYIEDYRISSETEVNIIYNESSKRSFSQFTFDFTPWRKRRLHFADWNRSF